MNIWWQLILIRSQIIMKLFMWSKLWWNIIKKKYILRVFINVFQIWFNVYLLTSYMTRFGLWIFMSKITHDFWLCYGWSHHILSTHQSVIRVWFMVFNATFNTISAISLRSVLLVDESGVPWENRSAASHWQKLSHNVVSSTPRRSVIRTFIPYKFVIRHFKQILHCFP